MNRRKFFKSLGMLAAVPVAAMLPEPPIDKDFYVMMRAEEHFDAGYSHGLVEAKRRRNPLSDEDMFEERLRRGEVIQDENFEFKRTIDLNAGDRYLVQYCSFKVSTGGDLERHPGFYADLSKPMGTFTHNYIYT